MALKPTGATIHYSASRDLKITIQSLKETKTGYHFVIDRDGTIYQLECLSKRVHHAGRAMWNLYSPNRSHVAICLISWGLVKGLVPGAFESWSKRTVPSDDVIHFNGQPWDKATEAQFAALFNVSVWLLDQAWYRKTFADTTKLVYLREGKPILAASFK